MAETLVLTTPATTTVTSYSVRNLLISRDVPMVRIVVSDQNGVRSVHEYVDDVAQNLISQLNTMNFTNISLQRRILERLAADGKLGAGTVTGTPD